MLLSYKTTLLLGTAVLLLLFACKKAEPIAPDPNPTIVNLYPHLEGSFQAKRTRNGGLSDAAFNDHQLWRDTAEIALNVTTNGDVLFLLGFELEIDSVTQTEFTTQDTVSNGIYKLAVRYTHNYDSIYIRYNDPCGSAGNCSTVLHEGKKTALSLLPTSGTPYTLQVVRRSSTNDYGQLTVHTDTQYTQDIAINYSIVIANRMENLLYPLHFDLNGNVFNFTNFINYSKEFYDAVSPNKSTQVTETIYWQNDSFYLQHQLIDYPNGRPFPVDTLYYEYKGTKK